MKSPFLAGLTAILVLSYTHAEEKSKPTKQTTKDPETILTLPGVTADKAAGCVTISATATGLKSNDACEFLLITSNSGHDYESIAISKASAADINKAMAFLGFSRGECVNYEKLRFWPKGERMAITFQGPNKKQVRAEKLLLDTRAEKTLPEKGFMYTGSIDQPKNNKESEVYADDGTPGAIISSYNEPTTVFDTPDLASQEYMYGNIVPNPAYLFETGAALSIRVEQLLKKGESTIIELSMNVKPSSSDNASGIEGLSMKVTDKAGKLLNDKDNTITGALKVISEIAGKKQDVFLSIKASDTVTIKQYSDLARVLQSIETPNGVRIEPPCEGALYYKAFMPDPEFLNRKTRIMHPWELRLKKDGDKLSGTLTQTRNEWADETMVPIIHTADTPVAGGEDIRKAFEADAEKSQKQETAPNIRVMLVIAAGDMKVGEMISFIKPILKTHGTVHVFTEDVLKKVSLKESE